MSRVQSALEEFVSRLQVPKETPVLDFQQAQMELDRAHEKLTTSVGQEELLSIIRWKGGTEWTLRVIEDNRIYNQVKWNADKLRRSLNDIPGFEGCTLFLENGIDKSRMYLSYPPQPILVTWIKVKY